MMMNMVAVMMIFSDPWETENLYKHEELSQV